MRLLPIRSVARFLRLIAPAVAACCAVSADTLRINEFSAWPALVTDADSSTSGDWRIAGFDASQWSSGTLPLGMDSSTDYVLTTNLYDQMFGKASSLYLRTDRLIPSSLAQSSEAVVLTVDYDDAFILYINGLEVKRGNIGTPGTPVPYTATADSHHRASNDSGDGMDHRETYDLGPASMIFRTGVNVIAVQLHTHSVTSSDAYIDLTLRIGGSPINGPTTSWRYFIGTREPDVMDQSVGRESDWIEIHNPTEVDMDLNGWSLTDSASNPRKWSFPQMVLPANGYLVVLASGADQTDPAVWLETNFRLSSAGEYLALVDPDGIAVSEFVPSFPPQVRGTSYGWDDSSGRYVVFSQMTPWEPNAGFFWEGVAAEPQVSVERGYFDDPFVLQLSSTTDVADIRYTTDGTTPTASRGQVYSAGGIEISTTTVLRAAAFGEGYLPSRVVTHSYIFVEDVIAQGNRPTGYPSVWKNQPGQPDLPADYEMDPEITGDPLYRDELRASLLSIPAVSLVTDREHLFDRDTGIYMNPLESGDIWERPVSVEWIYPGGESGVQINAGLRIQGGHTRNPRNSPKHSFRLAFRGAYEGDLQFQLFPEPDATNTFDTIILRAGGNQSWTHHNEFRGDNRGRAQYVRDQFAKDMQGMMGSPYLHNHYAFLYINGLFWGLYNPTERATNHYGAQYLGGDEDDYDSLNSGKVLDGTSAAWDQLFALVRQNLTLNSHYQRVAGMLDLEAFTDYMLLNHWAGNEDWDHQNWYALRNRNGGKFYFIAWDNEFFFETARADVTGKNTVGNPGEIFHSLLRNQDYRMLVADRIHKHFNHDGILTTEAAMRVWEERTAQVYPALVAESARWGDYRRDVHRRGSPFELYTRDNQWQRERNRLLNTVIPVRNGLVLGQYRSMGLIPATPPPQFSRQGGVLTEWAPLRMSTTDDGAVIYFTNDGTDPRQAGGQIAPAAQVYSSTIQVSERTRILARARIGTVWSALQSGDFHPPGDPADLQITEVHYAPIGKGGLEGRELEFIEIRNTGPEAVPLDGLAFTDGISFQFPAGRILAPGEYTVVVSNLLAFSGYHSGVRIEGQYSGQLSNSGERVALEHQTLGLIQELVYSDWHPWPHQAAVAGHSLVPARTGERGYPTESRAWRASTMPGGSPGSADGEWGIWASQAMLGWVYSPQASMDPGLWGFSSVGFFFTGPQSDIGQWLWVPFDE